MNEHLTNNKNTKFNFSNVLRTYTTSDKITKNYQTNYFSNYIVPITRNNTNKIKQNY